MQASCDVQTFWFDIYIAFVVKPERDGEMWSKDNGKEFRDLVLQKKIVFLKKINRVRKEVTHDCV